MTAGQQFRVLSVLGRGPLGTTYLVERAGQPPERMVIKLLNGDVSGATEALARLEVAMISFRAIIHPNIARQHAVLRFGALTGVVAEPVDGVDLGQLLDLGPIPAGPALEIVAQIGAGLQGAWTQAGPDGAQLCVIHGGLHAENVMVSPWGEVRLLDFGVYRALLGADGPEGFPVRTDRLVPPGAEDGAENPALDVYALGALFLELISGRPFRLRAVDRAAHQSALRREMEELRKAGVDELALTLAEALLSWEPETRPIARDVERLAREFRRMATGMSLREWAQQHVPEARREYQPPADDLVGTVLRGTDPPPRAAGFPLRLAPRNLPAPAPLRSARPVEGDEEITTMVRTRPGGSPGPGGANDGAVLDDDAAAEWQSEEATAVGPGLGVARPRTFLLNEADTQEIEKTALNLPLIDVEPLSEEVLPPARPLPPPRPDAAPMPAATHASSPGAAPTLIPPDQGGRGPRGPSPGRLGPTPTLLGVYASSPAPDPGRVDPPSAPAARPTPSPAVGLGPALQPSGGPAHGWSSLPAMPVPPPAASPSADTPLPQAASPATIPPTPVPAPPLPTAPPPAAVPVAPAPPPAAPVPTPEAAPPVPPSRIEPPPVPAEEAAISSSESEDPYDGYTPPNQVEARRRELFMMAAPAGCLLLSVLIVAAIYGFLVYAR